jgi:hypothetical protein
VFRRDFHEKQVPTILVFSASESDHSPFSDGFSFDIDGVYLASERNAACGELKRQHEKGLFAARVIVIENKVDRESGTD